jgi:hypothetical protein
MRRTKKRLGANNLGVNQLRDAWQRYRDGDPIFDDELRALIKDTRNAIDTLIYRREFGIATRTLCQDLATLEGYQRARKEAA